MNKTLLFNPKERQYYLVDCKEQPNDEQKIELALELQELNDKGIVVIEDNND